MSTRHRHAPIARFRYTVVTVLTFKDHANVRSLATPIHRLIQGSAHRSRSREITGCHRPPGRSAATRYRGNPIQSVKHLLSPGAYSRPWIPSAPEGTRFRGEETPAHGTSRGK